MSRIIASLVAGVFVGAALSYVIVDYRNNAVTNHEPAPVSTLRQIPKMSERDAEIHRTARYETLKSVADILALPSEFAQTEATYILAGRSNSSGIQTLIYEASGIAATTNRDRALAILFARLTELDPASALAMARTREFAHTSDLESEVWRNWGRYDLDGALVAAQMQSSIARRNVAAQALFTAYGYLGNEFTDRIEDELGIRPDSTLRARYLYKLADQSAVLAIEYINRIVSSTEKSETIGWLASHLVRTDPERAPGYADLITDPVLRERYENTVSARLAAVDPRATLDRLLVSTGISPDESEIWSAMRAMVSQDIESSLLYFEQMRSSDHKRNFAYLISWELAQNDPARAISWAKDNEDEHRMMTSRVLSEIAKHDPELAMLEAGKIKHASRRSNAYSRILRTMAESDPVSAAEMIKGIENITEREQAEQQVVSKWATTDPDAAIQWVMESDSKNKESALEHIGQTLAATDIDAAIRLLPKLDEKTSKKWRLKIAQQLGNQQSAAAAQSFISRFEGNEDYSKLQLAVVRGLAQQDIVAAKVMVDQMPSGSERDSAYAQMIRIRAQTDPREAAVWISSISDEQQRGYAVGQLAGAWHEQDPAAAARWADNLPRGSKRDDAIIGMASRWQEITPSRQLMLDSIGNVEKQEQATLSRIRIIARTDWRKAQSMLNNLSVSNSDRARSQRYIDYFRNR
jgi:hypothetical protein